MSRGGWPPLPRCDVNATLIFVGVLITLGAGLTIPRKEWTWKVVMMAAGIVVLLAGMG